MHSRKRRAPEPLPPRNSKHPRSALVGYDGGAPSPSEKERILCRWTRIGQEFLDLVTDTAMALFPGSLQEQIGLSVPDEPTSSPSSSLASTPQQTPSPQRVADDQADDTSTPKQNTSLKPRSARTTRDPNARFYLTRQPTINEDDETTEIAKLSTPQPRTLAPSKSWPLTPPPDSSSEHELRSVVPGMTRLQLEDSFSSSLRSSQTSDSIPSSDSKPGSRSSQSLRRRIRNRPHIYEKVHKAQVRRSHVTLREEMAVELFRLKQRTGFTSGFSDFKGLLDYQRQLQNIDLEHAPLPQRPSSSFGATIRNRRRAPESEEDFLQRAIDNAKATLSSPKPPKPYSPTLEQLELWHRKRDDAIERRLRPPVVPLPSSLPPDDDKQVSALLQKRGVISKFAREQVSDQDLSRLRPGQWLNDELINFYGAMILARSEESKENSSQAKPKQPKKKPLNVHYFSSFFWVKLTQEGYDKGRLAKWTKKIDIFSKDIILLPVNHGNAHWTAAAINFREKRFESYDSMDMAKDRVWKALRSYVEDEHKNKRKTTINLDDWENWAPSSTPQQENGFDCGVFTCQFLEALSRGEESFNFSQKDMPYLRRRMIWEIGNAKLRDGH
ncbi:hypothetical protein GALMADRAFT_217849 [Galerina marginata CBS 339.88]|uniref:Ubiquitin-like protease family profile domain-containing protein n=1 Tax=Galerina marginata (strain CBS 339.88) TaxID=685588 RepID=A0A067TR40_GALM3|nr:hypothetical protein GALMADRAFT_217849 [Galerina marginata CBS 339.88]